MDLTPVGVVLAMSWIQMSTHALVRDVAYYSIVFEALATSLHHNILCTPRNQKLHSSLAVPTTTLEDITESPQLFLVHEGRAKITCKNRKCENRYTQTHFFCSSRIKCTTMSFSFLVIEKDKYSSYNNIYELFLHLTHRITSTHSAAKSK